MDREVRLLSAAQRQLVEIAKALALNSTLIIFDEPTASLSPPEVERLFQVMTTLKRSGHTLVFVSHRLEEVFAITDRVTVMREGRTVAKSLETASLRQAELIRLMVGQEMKEVLPDTPNRPARPSRTPVFEVRNLGSTPVVRDVSFKVQRGEILGLGGLVGAGRSETVEALFGLRPRQRGELYLDGKPYALEPSLLILDEPTKGVDIGTRTSIYAMLRHVADTGVGVIVISSDFEELLSLCERVVVMSDGASIADVPSEMLNEEKLTLFAAPRTSMEQNSAVLHDIARDLNGAAFWTLVDQGRLFCLYISVINEQADPGFRAGDTPMIRDTRIPAALSSRSEALVLESENQLATLLLSVRSRRGHDMGWIGVTLDDRSPLPPAQQLRDRIKSFLGRIVKPQ